MKNLMPYTYFSEKNVTSKNKLISTVSNFNKLWVGISNLKPIRENQINSLNSMFIVTKIPEIEIFRFCVKKKCIDFVMIYILYLF